MAFDINILPDLLITIPFMVGYTNTSAFARALLRKDLYNEQAAEAKARAEYEEEMAEENDKGSVIDLASRFVSAAVGFVFGGPPGAAIGWNAGSAIGRQYQKGRSGYFDGKKWLSNNELLKTGGKFNAEMDRLWYQQEQNSLSDMENAAAFGDLMSLGTAMWTGLDTDWAADFGAPEEIIDAAGKKKTVGGTYHGWRTDKEKWTFRNKLRAMQDYYKDNKLEDYLRQQGINSDDIKNEITNLVDNQINDIANSVEAQLLDVVSDLELNDKSGFLNNWVGYSDDVKDILKEWDLNPENLNNEDFRNAILDSLDTGALNRGVSEEIMIPDNMPIFETYPTPGPVEPVKFPNTQPSPTWNIDITDTNRDASGEIMNEIELLYSGNVGCTDPAASNYNPEASEDDGTCVYEDMLYKTGYDFDAYIPDGSDTGESKDNEDSEKLGWWDSFWDRIKEGSGKRIKADKGKTDKRGKGPLYEVPERSYGKYYKPREKTKDITQALNLIDNEKNIKDLANVVKDSWYFGKNYESNVEKLLDWDPDLSKINPFVDRDIIEWSKLNPNNWDKPGWFEGKDRVKRTKKDRVKTKSKREKVIKPETKSWIQKMEVRKQQRIQKDGKNYLGYPEYILPTTTGDVIVSWDKIRQMYREHGSYFHAKSGQQISSKIPSNLNVELGRAITEYLNNDRSTEKPRNINKKTWNFLMNVLNEGVE